ncbi:GNAT family N-acetyltransferase [Malaciobacter marinus]|uniref:GNAT family N-acetyltransferase n=1 Tax=Malaciobacter marinus TaxID=505249 RepID=UPI003AFFA780
MIKVKNLDYVNSISLLNKFQILEESYYSDWYDCDDENAEYIWAIDGIDNPLGFLSYKILFDSNINEYIYIVKIYVLSQYRGQTPILIEGERVSEILFRQIEKKEINILTLESACDKLDDYYESLGFRNIQEISNGFSQIKGTHAKIIVKTVVL